LPDNSGDITTFAGVRIPPNQPTRTTTTGTTTNDGETTGTGETTTNG